MKKLNILFTAPALLFLATSAAQAMNISGTITTTLTITGYNKLTGNVTCKVVGPAPCIAFGANNTELDLNGFTITGDLVIPYPGPTPPSFPTCTNYQTAISTKTYTDAKIQGPGIVTFFTGDGVDLTGSDAELSQVVVTNVCLNGIVVGTDGAPGNNNVHNNSVSRSAYISSGSNGIDVHGSGNTIQQNSVVGVVNGYGIRIYVSTHNKIVGNNSSASGLGIFLDYAGYNLIQGNQALGNTQAGGTIWDIVEYNTGGTNTYQGNLCQRSAVFGTGVLPPCPNLPGNLIGNGSSQDQNNQQD